MRLHAEGLTKVFGRVVALRDVSFGLEARRAVVIGQNGSGKSTLLSILYGLLRPSSGSLRVNGYEPYVDRERAAAEMTIVFEKPHFDISVRVRDVYEVLRDVGDSDCLEFFWNTIGVRSLSGRQLPDLSSGQKQLVQLMQALCRESRIKVLDEPFSHLDVRVAGLVGDYILNSHYDVVMTTHVPEEAEWIGEYFIMLKEGRIVWQGSFNELAVDGIYEAYLRGRPPDGLDVILKLGYVAVVRSGEDELLRLVNCGAIAGFRRLGVRRYF